MKTTILHIIIFLITSFFSSGLSSQKVECKKYFDEQLGIAVYTHVDTFPQYPHGESEMMKFIGKEVRFVEQDIFQGVFKLEFIVSSEGDILNPKIFGKEVSENTPMENEFLRVLRMMPKWNPGKCSGDTVPVKLTFPIRL